MIGIKYSVKVRRRWRGGGSVDQNKEWRGNFDKDKWKHYLVVINEWFLVRRETFGWKWIRTFRGTVYQPRGIGTPTLPWHEIGPRRDARRTDGPTAGRRVSRLDGGRAVGAVTCFPIDRSRRCSFRRSSTTKREGNGRLREETSRKWEFKRPMKRRRTCD